MHEENMAKVVFAVVDEGSKLGLMPFGAQYCFKVDKQDKFLIKFKHNDTQTLEEVYPYGVHTVNVSLHKNYDKAGLIPSVVQSGTIEFEVKEGFVTRITAYRPEVTKLSVAIGTPPKVKLDVTLFPEELYNS